MQSEFTFSPSFFPPLENEPNYVGTSQMLHKKSFPNWACIHRMVFDPGAEAASAH